MHFHGLCQHDFNVSPSPRQGNRLPHRETSDQVNPSQPHPVTPNHPILRCKSSRQRGPGRFTHQTGPCFTSKPLAPDLPGGSCTGEKREQGLAHPHAPDTQSPCQVFEIARCALKGKVTVAVRQESGTRQCSRSSEC